MASIVNIDCFKGYYDLSTNKYSLVDLQSYIDQYEEYYLCKLLGNELRDLLLLDLLDGVPQDPEYLEWFNPFCKEDTCCGSCYEIQSQGVKKMLTGFIYYHFLKDDNYRHTITGGVVSKNENSEVLSPWNIVRVADQRYNDSVISFNAIRKCFLDNSCCKNICEMKLKFGDLI